MSAQGSVRWSHRFILVSLIQGLLAVAWTIPIIMPNIRPPVSMVIASGSAGTWFTVGYLMYIIAGVVGNVLMSLIYQHYEIVEGKKVEASATPLPGSR